MLLKLQTKGLSLFFRYVDEVQDNLLIDAWRKFQQGRLVVIGITLTFC